MSNASQTDSTIFIQLSQMTGRKSPERIRFNCQQAFQDIDLHGKTVLEIGAGKGMLSAYAATHGAKYVVARAPYG